MTLSIEQTRSGGRNKSKVGLFITVGIPKHRGGFVYKQVKDSARYNLQEKPIRQSVNDVQVSTDTALRRLLFFFKFQMAEYFPDFVYNQCTDFLYN